MFRYLILFVLLSTLSTCLSNVYAKDQPLKALTYNIRQDTRSDKGARDWSQRKDKLTGYLVNSNASIIGLQEVQHNQLLDVDKALANHTYVGVGRDDAKTRGEYSPIFYDTKLWKLDPKQHGTFWLSDTPDKVASKSWGNGIPRICTWARLIGQDGQAIYIYNMHWDHRSQPSREKAAELMVKTIRARKNSKEPFILMGDLNATTHNPAIKTLLGSGLMIDPCKKQFSTFSGWKTPLVPGLRIDHAFTSTSIKKATAGVESNSGVNSHAASDHHPVVLSLSLPSLVDSD